MHDPAHALPAGDYGGECVLTSLDYGRKIFVSRADPRILISGELAREALGAGPGYRRLTGNRLVIDGVNQRVIYLIGAYRPDDDTYEAGWPD